MMTTKKKLILANIRDGRPMNAARDWIEVTELAREGYIEMAKDPQSGLAVIKGLTDKGRAEVPTMAALRAPEKSLYEVTLAGQGPEPVRVTPSELIELESRHTITTKRKIEGRTLNAELLEAASKCRRHAELTGNTAMQAKYDAILEILLRDSKLLDGGGSSRRNRDQTEPGIGRR